MTRNSDLLTEDIIIELKRLKNIAVDNNNQQDAKDIWCLETIYLIKKLFLNAFKSMKDNNFKSAWNDFDQCDIELGFLKKHIKYDDNKYDLLFIEKEIPKYQELFPYDFFTSREYRKRL
jgi:hypothetical protein